MCGLWRCVALFVTGCLAFHLIGCSPKAEERPFIEPMPAPSGRSIDARLAETVNRFAFELFARVAAKDSGQNLCVSPASVETALAMTYNGASGETRKAMAKTLRYGSLSREEANRASAGMMKVFHDPQIGVELAVGNSLWADRPVAFRPDFLKHARDAYQAQATSLDFRPRTLWQP